VSTAHIVSNSLGLFVKFVKDRAYVAPKSIPMFRTMDIVKPGDQSALCLALLWRAPGNCGDAAVDGKTERMLQFDKGECCKMW
jgi:hypothetical protein